MAPPLPSDGLGEKSTPVTVEMRAISLSVQMSLSLNTQEIGQDFQTGSCAPEEAREIPGHHETVNEEKSETHVFFPQIAP